MCENAKLMRAMVVLWRIFADVIVYNFSALAYDLPHRSRGRIYELNAEVDRVD